MPVNKGIIYESKVNSNLKKTNLQKKSFRGAKSNPNAPDCQLKYQGKDYNVEIKLDLYTDFGQGTLDYNLEKNKWILGGSKTKSAETFREILSSANVPDIVNKKWGPKGPPRKYSIPSKFFTKEDVKFDYDNFKETTIDIPNKAVSDYYASKDTYYIQIGGYGLYYMSEDVANLGVPELDLKLKLRFRIKRASSIPIYNYRFTTAIQVVKSSLVKSKYNLDDPDFLQSLSSRDANK